MFFLHLTTLPWGTSRSWWSRGSFRSINSWFSLTTNIPLLSSNSWWTCNKYVVRRCCCLSSLQGGGGKEAYPGSKCLLPWVITILASCSHEFLAKQANKQTKNTCILGFWPNETHHTQKLVSQLACIEFRSTEIKVCMHCS